MPVLKNVLGLDLGSYSLKAVELQQTLRGFEAVQLRSLPRVGDEVALPDVVRRFVGLHRLATDHVVAALPGDRLSSRRLHFPFRERRKLAQAVPFAVEAELPFDLEDVVVDWEIVGGERSRTEVMAAIAPRSEVSELLALLDQAGCAPRTLEAEGLVLGNLAAVFDLPGRRLLVDLGHRKTTFSVLLDGRAVAARTLPLAGRQLTEALASDRGLSAADAERAKCEKGVFGTGLGDAPPRTAKVLDRFAREITRTLGAVEDLLGGAPADELTLFGGTAQLDRLDAFLAERTGIPAARLGLPREGHGEGLVAGGPPILFAPAIALALRGTAQARTRMNFRQDEFAVRLDLGRFVRNFQTTAWIAAAGLLLAVLNFGIETALHARQATALEAQVAALYSEALPGQPVATSAVAALAEQVRSAQDRADFLGVYRGNLSALDLLTELSGLVPPDLDIGLEELSIDRQTVRMRVQAKSFQAADRLGLQLGKFGPFASARIGAIEKDPKTGSKRFNVTISLKEPEVEGRG
jgi:general secretion pathway protein L